MDRRVDETVFPLCDEIGLWREEVTGARAWSAGRAGLFLDRDGVVLQPIPYLHKASDALLVQGATELIRACNSCLLYTSPSPRDRTRSRMPSSA